MATSLTRALSVTASCLAAALAATWPLAINLTTAIPEGTEHEATVSIFSLWGLWWTANRAPHGFAGYWDAPFFHPASGVTTYSEPFPLVGLAVAPLWGLGLAPALIYNVAFLGLLTLNGVFGYRLARALGVLPVPALIGGLLTVTLPFVAKVEGALPLVAVFGIPWTLEGLIRFGKTGSTRWAIWAAAGLVATYLTCQQYALLFGPLALIGGLVSVAQQRFKPAANKRLLAAGLGAASVLALVALPGLRVRAEAGFHRSDDLVQALSARPVDFFTRPELAIVPFPPTDPSDTGGLFPGALLLALAAAGAIVGIRNPATRRWTLYLAATAAAALVLAMALNVNVAGWAPFATIRAIVPGMSELRSPTRATAILQLSLATLAVIGLSRAWSVVGRKGATLLALLGLLAAAENLSLPARLVTVPPTPSTAWADWLHEQPGDTVVAHVPFPDGLHVSDYEIEAWRMFAQIDHQKPIVNGYSGNFPQTHTPFGAIIPIYTQFQLAMAQQFPTEQLLCIMDRSQDVNTVVIDRDWLATHAAEVDAYKGFLQPAYTDEHVQIYRLQAPPGKCTSG